jgi:CBS domain-containing protein
MRANEIMSAAPLAVTPDERVSRVAALMEEADVGWIAVVDDLESMTLRGVITDRDIVLRHLAKKHRKDCAVAEHMTTRDLVAVRPDTDMADVLDAMRHAHVRRVAVIDADHRLVGVISLGDIALIMAEPDRVLEVLQWVSQPAHAVH